MLIPHSEKKIFNFQISVFSLLFFVAISLMLMAAFVGLSTHFTTAGREIDRMSQSLVTNEKALEMYRDAVTSVRKSAQSLEDQLVQVLTVLNTDNAQSFLEKGTGGDLSSLIQTEELGDRSLRDLSELKSISATLDNAVGPLGEIYQILQSEMELLVEIPTLWPVANGQGQITLYFGPAKHPFTGLWYLHKGLDIAWMRGTPIVAAADGEVLRVEENPMQLGKYVVLRHRYGFSTRYGHLDRWVVEAGQQVRRGEVIGYLGTSGVSTGPHLHYEVRIAGQVVDPRLYLNIKSRLVDGTSVLSGNR
jgi:murein DD-endopeptidase MepM/ murein hydrolase activator NlpD